MYGVDLLGVYTGHLSVRRLRVLVDGLSPDDRTSRRRGNWPEIYDDWTTSGLLLGRLLEAQLEGEEEVIPRASTTDTTTETRPAAQASSSSIPVVSLREAMGFGFDDEDAEGAIASTPIVFTDTKD